MHGHGSIPMVGTAARRLGERASRRSASPTRAGPSLMSCKGLAEQAGLQISSGTCASRLDVIRSPMKDGAVQAVNVRHFTLALRGEWQDGR